MSFLQKLFGKEKEISTYSEFWIWFKKYERDFFKTVKSGNNIDSNFFDKISPKLNGIKECFYFLSGMADDNTAELIITADADIRNIVFVEELIAAAPKIDGWKFTALKPSMNINELLIEMEGFSFGANNIFFYSNDLAEYPDEIDICLIHNDLDESNKEKITRGTYIFLENYLGELEYINSIDHIQVISKAEAEKELVPISKLKDFLVWREKEYQQKYDGVVYKSGDDDFSSAEGKLKSGNVIVSIFNSNVLKWDSKSSHSWIAVITMSYDGQNTNGMPNKEVYNQLNLIEDEVVLNLKEEHGYINVARETGNNQRVIYFACKEFRKPSKVLYKIQTQNADKFEISFDIYKDKYWQTFERFNFD